jgi:hypothetical protein
MHWRSHVPRRLLLMALMLAVTATECMASRSQVPLARQLLQDEQDEVRVRYITIAWTVRGRCGSPFLEGLQGKLAKATQADLEAFPGVRDVKLLRTWPCTAIPVVRRSVTALWVPACE